MPKLLLDSLEIHNFRAFESLSIDKLSRVNLITGKNNSGKTTLLEAIWLYAQGGSPFSLLDLMVIRDQFPLLIGDNNQGNGTSQRHDLIEVLNLKHLFYHCEDIIKEMPSFSISPIHPIEKKLEVKLCSHDGIDGNSPNLTVTMDRQQIFESSITHLLERSRLIVQPPNYVKAQFVAWQLANNSWLSKLWDDISLSELEKDLLNGLKMIVPNVQQVGFRGDEGVSVGRIPIIRIDAFAKPIPLKTLGAGVYRLFYIILSLVNAENGIVLIDEVDTGIHFSALKELWSLIFILAEKLNIQVFAVTHSWECIEAFSQISETVGNSSGTLVRLSNPKGETRAVTFSGEELTTINDQTIEVR